MTRARARKALSLDFDRARTLFEPLCKSDLPEGMLMKEIEPAHAARVLRHLAETGEGGLEGLS